MEISISQFRVAKRRESSRNRDFLSCFICESVSGRRAPRLCVPPSFGESFGRVRPRRAATREIGSPGASPFRLHTSPTASCRRDDDWMYWGALLRFQLGRRLAWSPSPMRATPQGYYRHSLVPRAPNSQRHSVTVLRFCHPAAGTVERQFGQVS